MGSFLDKPITSKSTVSEEVKIGSQSIRYAVSSMQGWRVHMEDAHIHRVGLPLGPSNSKDAGTMEYGAMFAVFDGHGGALIAQQAAQTMADVFVEQHKNSSTDPVMIGESLKKTFLAIDEKMRELPTIKEGSDHSGTTALSIILTKNSIIVANAGDSRFIRVSKDGTVKFATDDHKPNNPIEMQRIMDAGGHVAMKRVNGDLAVSRCLGDYMYKANTSRTPSQQQVSPEPDIHVLPLAENDGVLVIGCDGIWDVMSNDDCAKFLQETMDSYRSLGACAEALLDSCLELGSRDNMSVVLVEFPPFVTGAIEATNAPPSTTSHGTPRATTTTSNTATGSHSVTNTSSSSTNHIILGSGQQQKSNHDDVISKAEF